MDTYNTHNIKNTHYDQYLTNISVGYKDTNNYIAEKVVPVVEVLKQSDRYMVFDYQDEKVKDDDIRRAPGTVASEMRTGWSDDAFFCEGYAKRYALYDEEIANADEDRIFGLKVMVTSKNSEFSGQNNEIETFFIVLPAFNGVFRGDDAKQVKEKLLLAKEYKAASFMTNPNNFHTDLKMTIGTSGSGSDIVKWSDYADSDPMKDIFKLKEKAERLGSPDFNTLIISKPVYNILKFHPKLKATLAGFISPELVSDEAIKQLLDVQNLIVADARIATNAQRRIGEGGLTNYIWGNNAVLMYLPSAPGRDVPAAAYTFQWTNPEANVVGNTKTREYYDEASKTLWVESEEWYAIKGISKVSAVVLSDIVDPLT